ncbi:MAG: beta-carotene hydroxylase [Deltaproteobacteria bacterium]|nr:MAG: beta-carotene hydroxylase [Deltaproteobacteria bacterium]
MTLVWITVAVLTAVLMEPWAAFVHRVLWHGPLWSWHESHHVETEGWFEANDTFALMHAIPAIVLIVGGCEWQGSALAANVAFGVGIGMTMFGASYALVHDGLVHERLPVKFLLRWRWFRRIRGAHRRHHTGGGYPYGLFWGPTELQDAVRRGDVAREQSQS